MTFFQFQSKLATHYYNYNIMLTPQSFTQVNESKIESKEECNSVSWQTGEANRDRKKKNLAAKKSHKKQESSKNSKPETLARENGEKDAMREIAEEKKAENTVVHPWHLSFVKHTWVDQYSVTVDEKVGGTDVYRVARWADNLRGTGLFRTEEGAGQIPLPRVWGNLEYVRKACEPLVGESLGKTDLDMKFLVPRALVNLKSWISPWPGVEKEIMEFLNSIAYTQLVVDY